MEAKCVGQSRQEAKTGGLVYTLLRDFGLTCLCAVVYNSEWNVHGEESSHIYIIFIYVSSMYIHKTNTLKNINNNHHVHCHS